MTDLLEKIKKEDMRRKIAAEDERRRGEEVVERGVLVPAERTRAGDLRFAEPMAVEQMRESAMVPGQILRGEISPTREELGALGTRVAADFVSPSPLSRMAVPLIPGRRSKLETGPLTKQQRKEIVETAPSAEDLTKESRDYFKQVETDETVISPEDHFELIERFDNFLKSERADEKFDKLALSYYKYFEDQIGKESFRFSDFDIMRKQLTAAMKDTGKSGRDDYFLRGMRDTLDDWLDETIEKAPALKEANRLWALRVKTQDIDEAIALANLDRGGFERGMETQLRRLMREDAKRVARGRKSRYTGRENEIMQRVIDGASPNLLKAIGNLTFRKGPLRGATGAVGAGLTAEAIMPGSGIPVAVAQQMMGRGVQSAADRAMQGEADIVRGVVASGGRVPPRGYSQANPGGIMAEFLRRMAAPTGRAEAERTEDERREMIMDTLKSLGIS